MQYRLEQKQKYYYMTISVDMLNDVVLTRANGTIGHRNGMLRHSYCESMQAAQALQQKLLKQKLNRGYQLT